MPEIDPVILQLRADKARYEADIRASTRMVQDNLGKQEASARRLEKQFESVGNGIGRSARLIGLALAGVSTAALVQGFLRLTDEAKKLDAQLKLATAGYGSFGQAQEDVRRIADETRAGLSETASLYANFTRGAKELGATQAEAARATETFSKALKISGADANQAASATLQFGQALASGALRGDELNSILEASPRLARLLADSMGRPIGEIKKLGEEGALTSDKLLRALTDQKFTDGIDSEFRELPVTFGDAMTKVQNAAMITFAAFDRGGEFSTALANFITDGADGFEELEKSAEDLGVSIRSSLDGLSDAFEPLEEAGNAVFDALGLKAEDFAFDLKREITDVLKLADLLAKGVTLGQYNPDFAGRYQRGQAASEKRQRARLGEAWLQRAASGMDVMGNPIAGTPGGPSSPRTPMSSGGGSSKARATRAPASKLNPEAFAREEASLNDQILRLKEDEARNATERAATEMERIASAKAAAMKDIASDERYTAAQKEKIVALTEAVSALEEARVIAERDVQIARNLLDIRLSGIRNEQDLLSAQAETASTRSERRAIELRLLDLAYEQERAELEAIIASKQATDAQKNIAEERLRILGQLQGSQVAGIERQFESPMERYRREAGEVGKNINDSLEQVQVDGLRSLNDGLTEAIMGTRSLGDVFKNVANQIIADLIRISIQKTIVGAISGGLGSILPFAGGTDYAHGGLARVGETGPETVVLPRGAKVIPAGETRTLGRQAPVVNQTFVLDARGGITTPELLEYVNTTAQREAARAGQAAYQGAVRDTPALMAKRQRYGS